MTAPFKEDKKIEILTYARDHGVVAASRHFGVFGQQRKNLGCRRPSLNCGTKMRMSMPQRCRRSHPRKRWQYWNMRAILGRWRPPTSLV